MNDYSDIKEENKDIQEEFLKTRENNLKTGLLENDEFWIVKILKFLFKFYDSIIADNIIDFSSKSEKEIKIIMYRKIKNDEVFKFEGLKINRETASENTEQEGYYDIKIEHSGWNNYFVFECKCLGKSNQINRYIYCKETNKKGEKYDDGGLYRFVINKYATYQEFNGLNQKFGGLIGFVQKGNIEKIIDKIKDKIKLFQLTNNDNAGELIDKDLLDKLVYKRKNTFNSNHTRCQNKNSNELIKPIHIYHIFFDFTTN